MHEIEQLWRELCRYSTTLHIKKWLLKSKFGLQIYKKLIHELNEIGYSISTIPIQINRNVIIVWIYRKKSHVYPQNFTFYLIIVISNLYMIIYIQLHSKLASYKNRWIGDSAISFDPLAFQVLLTTLSSMKLSAKTIFFQYFNGKKEKNKVIVQPLEIYYQQYIEEWWGHGL